MKNFISTNRNYSHIFTKAFLAANLPRSSLFSATVCISLNNHTAFLQTCSVSDFTFQNSFSLVG